MPGSFKSSSNTWGDSRNTSAMPACTSSDWPTTSMSAAAAIIVAVGVIDDKYNLRARYKLAGQAVAAAVLISLGGVVIERVGVFGRMIELGQFAVPVTLFWLLAFFLVPMGIVWLYSFGQNVGQAEIEISGTLDNYKRATECCMYRFS